MLHPNTRMTLFGASRQVTASPLSGIKAEVFSSFRCGITQEAKHGKSKKHKTRVLQE